MFYSFIGKVKHVTECKYCLTENENGQVFLSLRKSDESEQLLLDFGSKLTSGGYEPSILPEGILIMEDNRYTNDCFMELVNADIVRNHPISVQLQGVPCIVCSLTERFNLFRESRKAEFSLYNASAFA